MPVGGVEKYTRFVKIYNSYLLWISNASTILTGISLSLNGVDMPNNSRISLDSIGCKLNNALICHTDDESGDWYYPNRKIVPSQGNLGLDLTTKLRITISFYTYEGNGLVHLYREGVPSLLGQFTCKTSHTNTRVFVIIGKETYLIVTN